MNGGIHELNLNGLSDTVSGMLQEANVASQLWACTVLVPAATFFLSGPPGFLLTPALSSATCSRSVNLACVGSRVLIRVLGNRQCELGRYWRLLPVGTLGCLLGRTVHASGTLLAVITATEVLFCTFWAVRSCWSAAKDDLTRISVAPFTLRPVALSSATCDPASIKPEAAPALFHVAGETSHVQLSALDPPAPFTESRVVIDRRHNRDPSAFDGLTAAVALTTLVCVWLVSTLTPLFLLLLGVAIGLSQAALLQDRVLSREMLLTGCASFTTGLSIGAFGCPSAMVLALLGGAPRGELNPDTAIITLALLLLSWLMAPAASSWLLAALGMACCAEWARQRLTLLWSIRFRLRKLPKAWLNVVGHALTGVVAVVATRSMWAE